MEQAQEIIDVFDGILLTAAETLFSGTAGILGPFFITLATLMVAFIGLDMGIGLRAVRHEEIVRFLVRLVLVFIFAFSWANFAELYNALTDTTANLALNMFDIAKDKIRPTTAHAAMEQFGGKATDAADQVIAAQSSIVRGVVGGMLYLMIGAMFAAYLLIVALAKIVVAILISLAPLAIIATMFERTKSYFEEWLSSLIAYSLYPVAAAAIVATMTLAIDTATMPEEGVSTLKSILVFLTLVFACTLSLFAIPFIASSITGKLNLAPIASAALAPLKAGGVALAKPTTMLAKKMEQVRSGWKNNGMTTQQVKASERMGTKSDKNYAEMGRKMHEKFDRIKENQKLKMKNPPKN